ncbi:MAG TPA: hypothetical protein VF790_06325 [Dissulfurispiraceae bacterium]
MKEPVENSEEFLRLLTEWQKLEDSTIASANAMIGRTNNPLIKMTMETIKHDSEKHKIILQMIRDTITNEAIHLAPEELAALSDMLNTHMEIEAGSLALAEDAYRKSGLFTTRYLLSILIADEAKHHGMINQLNELKRLLIPTSAGVRP